MDKLAELLETGRDLERRINRFRCCPADTADERAGLLEESIAFVLRVKPARMDACEALFLPEGCGCSAGKLQEHKELLRLVSVIARELNTGYFYR